MSNVARRSHAHKVALINVVDKCFLYAHELGRYLLLLEIILLRRNSFKLGTRTLVLWLFALVDSLDLPGLEVGAVGCGAVKLAGGTFPYNFRLLGTGSDVVSDKVESVGGGCLKGNSIWLPRVLFGDDGLEIEKNRVRK